MNNLGLLDLYEKSNNDIATELGKRFKSYRIALNLTQKEIADQSGLSIMTVVRFEKGEAGSIRLDNLIALMRSIDKLEGIYEAIPVVHRSLYDSSTSSDSPTRRVRKKKNER